MTRLPFGASNPDNHWNINGKMDYNSVVEKNRPLILFFMNRRRINEPDWEDVYSVCLVSLCQAADKWSPERSKWSTFASSSINHAISSFYVWKHKLKRRELPQYNDTGNYSLFGRKNQLSHEDNDFINYCMDILNNRDRDIIYKYFIDNETLEFIGELYNLSKERIRQIINEALTRIRNKLRSQGFQIGDISTKIAYKSVVKSGD